jgi:hypothetical protein
LAAFWKHSSENSIKNKYTAVVGDSCGTDMTSIGIKEEWTAEYGSRQGFHSNSIVQERNIYGLFFIIFARFEH